MADLTGEERHKEGLSQAVVGGGGIGEGAHEGGDEAEHGQSHHGPGIQQQDSRGSTKEGLASPGLLYLPPMNTSIQ